MRHPVGMAALGLADFTHRGESFRGSWAATFSNGWRILFGCLLAVVPGFIVVISPSILIGKPPWTGAPFSWADFDDMLYIICVLFGLAFLSICYRELVLKRMAISVP